MKRLTHCACLLLILATLAAGCADAPDATDDAAAEADSMARLHEDDTPEATALVMEPRMPVDARAVSYGDHTGYLAAPTRPDSVAAAMGSDALPGVILIHEWWGLNENVEAAARRLAGEGFRVLAVDLYGGQTGATPDEARALMQEASSDRAAMNAHLAAAYDALATEYGAPTVGIMGWCFGGGVSLQGAVAMPADLDAAVIYYGRVSGYTDDELAALEMPVIGFFGADDQGIPVADVRAFEATLDELDKDVEIHVYDGAGHAFANPSGQNYVATAAADAWDKTTAFLKEHLY